MEGMNDHCGHRHCCDSHVIIKEVVAHVPYAIFSVAFALVILSFASFFFVADRNEAALCDGATILFHSFHFMHIVFAATGTVITFFRFSRNVWQALLLAVVCPITFCVMSDVLLPYIGGRLLGVPMRLHICFVTDITKVVPFLGVGIANGFIMSRHRTSMQPMYSVFSHSIHTLVSSLAAAFYLVSHGFITWYHDIGFVFIFLIIAVVIPCSMSDVVVPIFFAGTRGDGHEEH